ncbi:MAG: hypothetical protein HPY52_04340 [Firmicutes bacterium]|nr:hypothetical protein [Bacillota bacterium]
MEPRDMQGLWHRKGICCCAIITYNGRAFDVPFIFKRAEVLGIQSQSRQSFNQIDLLPCARRYYRRMLPDCKLSTIGAYILNLPREDDVPGWMIPDLYYRFISTGDSEIITSILEHNARDLLTLYLLSQHVRQLSEGNYRDRSGKGERSSQDRLTGHWRGSVS